MSFIKRCIREPLLHFIVLGGLVFIAFAAVSKPEVQKDAYETITVSLAQAERLAGQFRDIWRRPPTHAEMQSILSQYVREELLVREALSLSMDESDAIIRQRLAQKMDFLIASAVGAQSTTDQELRTFLNENQADYMSDTTIAFEQVFLGSTPEPDEIENVRVELEDGADPTGLGKSTLQPRVMRLSGPAAIDSNFGVGFHAALSTLEVGEWVLPVRSGFGSHAVRVTERRDGGPLAFDEVREKLEKDWLAAKTDEMKEEYLLQLRQNYTVTLPDETELRELLE